MGSSFSGPHLYINLPDRPGPVTILQRYQAYVFRTIGHEPAAEPNLGHWRDRVFGVVLTYGLPLSLVAIIPGIFAAWLTGHHVLLVHDILVLGLLMLITLVPGISMGVRKAIFILLFYGVTIVLLYFLGLFGQGLLFMVVASVFTILFYPLRYALLFQFLNVVICLTFTLVIHYTDADIPFRDHYDTITWLSISFNAIFVSAVLVLLLHHILNGLQQAIEGQQRLREAAERSNKQLASINSELEKFAYVASHDLQEPLRMVTGFLDRLRKHLEGSLDEKARQYMDFAYDGAVRMKTTIRDILEYARAGRNAEPMVAVDMHALLKSLRNDLGLALEGSGGQLLYEGPDHLTLARAPLRQVLLNLAGNALKYRSVDKAPIIIITAEANAAMVHLAVTDNGIGIDPQFHELIFRMLQRLHRRDEYPGSGMGLTICKRVVEQMGGTIWVHSEVGQGSTFHFTMSTQAVALG